MGIPAFADKKDKNIETLTETANSPFTSKSEKSETSSNQNNVYNIDNSKAETSIEMEKDIEKSENQVNESQTSTTSLGNKKEEALKGKYESKSSKKKKQSKSAQKELAKENAENQLKNKKEKERRELEAEETKEL